MTVGLHTSLVQDQWGHLGFSQSVVAEVGASNPKHNRVVDPSDNKIIH